MKFGISCLVTILISVAEFSHGYSQNEVWGYNCSEHKCIKVQINEDNRLSVKSLASCRMFCSAPLATVWPKPTGSIKFEETLLPINPSGIIFNVPENKLWNAVQKRFNSIISNNIPEENNSKTGYTLKINISCEDGFSDGTPKLKLNTDEGYKLKINADEEYIEAFIFSKNFFGARHGLETLSQLIIYDNLQNKLVMVASAEINDKPSFEWRGVTLDTSRNFFSIDTIKTTLDGMAMSKLNTFHWHITDSHSFPFEVKSQPELHRLGAYDSKKVYTHEHIMDVVEYGLARGVRVLPEFDAPAHVGEGWQNLNMTTCFNAQPWEKYCVEPPCGQLDPTVPELYDVLEKIYDEMVAVFKPDIFHMGGDEVSFKCWNSSARIQKFLQTKGWGLEEDGFFRLWNYFQQEALRRYDKVRDSNVTPIILWTSRLTESPQIEKYLDPNRYIIQIWSGINDANIKNILQRGYRTIFSNYDALYLDCGGPGWVTGGQNWCSPYHGWQKIYSNSFETFRVGNENLVLGAEAAIWSEQIDDFTVMTRLFPRLSALAENLWTNSNQGWRKAESRFLLHRDWLVQNHIPAEALQPQWCLQNENECPIDSYRTETVDQDVFI